MHIYNLNHLGYKPEKILSFSHIILSYLILTSAVSTAADPNGTFSAAA